MKVSVIMAAKDTEPYLEECLDSILAQSYPHWELVAVNDHSTDRTREILDAYALRDSRIVVVDSPGNRLIPALQEGYRHATGDLINRMDSDDRMPHQKLELMVTAWEKVGRGHVVAGGTQHFVETGEVGGGFLRYENWLNQVARENTHYEQIYTECVIPSHCWMLHKEDFDLAGAFDSEIYPEDYDLCFRMYEAGLKVVGLDEILHYWRDRSDRISRTWVEYKDVRYFPLKLENFLKLDRDRSRPLVLWGAGRNGKDMAKELTERGIPFTWVCDNERKIGHNVYGTVMQSVRVIPQISHPQIMVVVASPSARDGIAGQLQAWGKQVVLDYWFFL